MRAINAVRAAFRTELTKSPVELPPAIRTLERRHCKPNANEREPCKYRDDRKGMVQRRVHSRLQKHCNEDAREERAHGDVDPSEVSLPALNLLIERPSNGFQIGTHLARTMCSRAVTKAIVTTWFPSTSSN